MDLRKRAKHSRDALPIGAVVVRRRRRPGHAKPLKVRFIKVRNSGPPAKRWMRYARWWWLQNQGPIPNGMRVIHADGDSLNDDPSNYVLGEPADAAYLWHERDPSGSAENYRRCAEATREMNRARKSVRRAIGYVRTWWYPVDFTGRRVLNRAFRKRWMVYGERVARNGRGGESRALGWPGLPFAAAAILSVLATGETVRGRADLQRRVIALRNLYWPASLKPLLPGAISSAVSWLLARQLILVKKRGHAPALYWITAKALAARGPVSPYVPRRGAEIMSECVGFLKVEPENGT